MSDRHGIVNIENDVIGSYSSEQVICAYYVHAFFFFEELYSSFLPHLPDG